MSVTYQSTRGGETDRSFEHVLLSAYAKDGGMFVPEQLPTIPVAELRTWARLSFPNVRIAAYDQQQPSFSLSPEWHLVYMLLLLSSPSLSPAPRRSALGGVGLTSRSLLLGGPCQHNCNEGLREGDFALHGTRRCNELQADRGGLPGFQQGRPSAAAAARQRERAARHWARAHARLQGHRSAGIILGGISTQLQTPRWSLLEHRSLRWHC